MGIPRHPATAPQYNRVLVPSPGCPRCPPPLALPHLPPPAAGAGRISSLRLPTALPELNYWEIPSAKLDRRRFPGDGYGGRRALLPVGHRRHSRAHPTAKPGVSDEPTAGKTSPRLARCPMPRRQRKYLPANAISVPIFLRTPGDLTSSLGFVS